ncbi:uncharacterized protein [Notamacropus eugenii]|uniref:uncharacterized protein n=1 Tax=Notamacropus eugenii TaxID=9315 RepID=UPI003B67B411
MPTRTHSRAHTRPHAHTTLPHTSMPARTHSCTHPCPHAHTPAHTRARTHHTPAHTTLPHTLLHTYTSARTHSRTHACTLRPVWRKPRSSPLEAALASPSARPPAPGPSLRGWGAARWVHVCGITGVGMLVRDHGRGDARPGRRTGCGAFPRSRSEDRDSALTHRAPCQWISPARQLLHVGLSWKTRKTLVGSLGASPGCLASPRQSRARRSGPPPG